jgi:hypothetical protein
MMKIIALFVLIFAGLSSRADMPSSATDFCANLASEAPERADGRSLMYVRKALGIDSLGKNAKDSAGPLEAAGFKNILADNPNLLKDENKIPKGSIFVLNKANSPTCPVSATTGHVPVKCGSNQLYWVAGQTKDLSEFIAQNPKCITAVMYNPKWKGAEAKKLPSSTKEFCDNLHSQAPDRADGKSLFHVREALGIDGGGLGINAKDSASKFEDYEFRNILAENPELLKDPGKIPEGSIFVLDKAQAPGCPISAKTGHVTVKCGSNELYWVAGQTKDLAAFISQNPKCIKAVMYNQKWDAPGSGITSGSGGKVN